MRFNGWCEFEFEIEEDNFEKANSLMIEVLNVIGKINEKFTVDYIDGGVREPNRIVFLESYGKYDPPENK